MYGCIYIYIFIYIYIYTGEPRDTKLIRSGGGFRDCNVRVMGQELSSYELHNSFQPRTKKQQWEPMIANGMVACMAA